MLQVPLAPMTSFVKVGIDSVCENHESIESLGLHEGQGIQAKVLKVLPDKNSLVLGCKRSQLWNGELEVCQRDFLKQKFGKSVEMFYLL